MGLLEVHADSIERRALFAAANPGPASEPTFSTWATLGAAAKGVPAGVMEGLGAIRDLARAGDERNVQQQRGRAERLGIQFDPSQQFVMPSGEAQRKKADEFMPDPLTAHWSEQVVGGLSKTVTKAGAAMILAGPTAGAGLFGLGEADDTAQRLMAKGVDSGTAWQVGGVVGAAAALGARLPVSGAALASTVGGKVAATAGLATVGGPLTYMAQEKLSKDILQKADYGAEAALHDPLNPIGLAASMFPFVIGGFALRGSLKKLPPLKTEADVRAAAQLSPAEQAASDAFERSAGNLADLRAAIAAEKRPEAKAVLQAELDTLLTTASKDVRAAVAAHGAADPAAVDAARVQVLDETLHRSLPNVPGAHAEMLRAADMVGAGERVSVESKPDIREIVVYHGTTAEIPEGQFSGGMFTSNRDRAENYAMGGKGRVVEARLDINNPMPWEQAFGKTPDEIKAAGYDGTIQWGKNGEVMRAVVVNSDQVIPVAPQTRTPISKTNEIRTTTEDRQPSRAQPAIDRAQTAMQDLQDSGKPLREFLTDANLPPEVHNLVVGMQKLDDTGRARLLADFEQAARTDQKMPLQDLAADVIEGKIKPQAAEQSPDAVAVQALAEQNPDMPVRLPGDEKNTTLAAALERIRDDQIKAEQEGELYRVAVQCFLTAGAAT